MALVNAEVDIDPADVEAELAEVLGCERADLELDDDEAGLGALEEEQVDVEVVAVDSEVVLAADEGESVAELEEEVLEPVHQRGLEVAFRDAASEVEEVQDVGVAGELLGELGVPAGSRAGKFDGQPQPGCAVGS